MLKVLNDSSRPRRQFWLVAAIILILSCVSYAPALNAPINWDDSDWLTDNTAVAHSHPGWIWTHHRSTASYYPLTLTSFWIEYHIWGLWLPGYRAVNILLHGASAVMLWLILKKISVPGALLAAMIWAVHPIQAESVVWIAERKNTLSGVFFFAGLLAWLRLMEPEITKKSRLIAYAGTFALMLGALFAKGSTVFFPVAALGIGWLYVGRLRRRDVLLSLPLFAAALAMALVTMYFERTQASNDFGREWELSLAQRVILSGNCFWFYIGKILWPDQLAFIYTRWELHANQPLEYTGFVSAALLFALLLWMALKKKVVRPLVGMTLYLAGIFPVIGVFKFYTQIFTYVADHYAYLGSAPLIALVVGLVFAGWQWMKMRTENFRLPVWLAPVSCAVAVVVLTALSSGQALLYRSYLAVWEETLRITPTAWIARNSIGQYMLDETDRTLDALAQFEEGLRAKRDPRLLTNAGLACERLGRHADARAYYDEAIAGGVRHYTPFMRRAFYALKENNPKLAIDLCERALINNQYTPTVWAVLGDAYRDDGQLENAAGAYAKCLELRPDAKRVHLVLGDIAYEMGKYAEAVAVYRVAASLEPENPRIRFNCAAALRKLGRDQEAQAQENIGNALVDRARSATQQPAGSAAPQR